MVGFQANIFVRLGWIKYNCNVKFALVLKSPVRYYLLSNDLLTFSNTVYMLFVALLTAERIKAHVQCVVLDMISSIALVLLESDL